MQKPSLLGVFLTVVIDLLGFGIVLPLLALYGDEYHAIKLTIGLLFSCFSAMQFITAPIWGRLSDRYGRRRVILFGLVGSVLSYLLLAAAPSMGAPLFWLFASRVTAGIFGGTLSSAQAYIADVTTPEERGRGMALIGVAFGIGFTLGPAIGGLGWKLDPSAPGLIAAAFSAIALVYAWFKLAEPERAGQHRTNKWFDLSALQAALKTPGVGAILAMAFVTVGVFALFESALSLLGKTQYGWEPDDVGWLFSYIGFCSMISQGVIVRRLLKKVGELPLLLVGPVLLAIGMAAIGMLPSASMLWVIAPLPVLGLGMIMPSLGSLLSRRTAASQQGGVLSVNQSIQSLSRIVGPVLGLSLFASDAGLPFLVGAGLMVIPLALGVRLKGVKVEDRY